MKDKPLRVAALCLVCLLLTAVPLAAQGDDEYSFIKEDIYGNIISLHLPSVEVRRYGSDNYVVGWIRIVYSDTGAAEYAMNGVKAHHSMDFWAANTKARQVQTISWTEYDERNRVLGSYSEYGGSFRPYAWEECVPGTNGDAIWLALMKAAGYR